MADSKFPKDFLWGAATSSFQIEGATQEGGRAPSIWDKFCAEPGKIADRSDGTNACDHYHRWESDLDLMKDLGLQAYRFSIAWPRVIPNGKGPLNETGLQFYDRLIDGLLKRGIEPWVTLYHWDLPLALDDKGGWLNRDTTSLFADYAQAMVARYGDRAKHWITHNEPWCVAHLGYRTGEHAPGHKDSRSAYIAAHHVLLSHGLASQAMRASGSNLKIGITLNLCPAYPASASIVDKKATEAFDGDFNRWYLDPVFKGAYPSDVLPRAEADCKGDLSFIRAGDLEQIKQPMDFFGINYYSRAVIRGDEKDPQQMPQTLRASSNVTDMGWEVYEEGLHDLLLRVQRDYDPKAVYITENGAAYPDAPGSDGRIHDKRRTQYVSAHLKAVKEAMDEGSKLKGYFLWSLFDNFEWAFGYEKRFGMVWVDYETQKRTPKDSALWYRNVIETRDPSIPEKGY